MTRILWQLVLVMSVAMALAQPAVAAGGGLGKVERVVNAIKQLADSGSATLATGAFVLFTCANMLSCHNPPDTVLNSVMKVPDEYANTLPIMQGATSTHQTQFFVLTSNADDYSFSLQDKTGDEIAPAKTEEHSFYGYDKEIQHVFFEGLGTGETYLFKVRSNHTDEIIDERELQTLAAHKNKLRFVFASCMWDSYPQGDIWEQMIAVNPDVIFLLGDNVYADLPPVKSHADLWKRYVETRATLSIFRNKKLIPIVATWDDHDYGANNSNRDYKFKKEALSTFRKFFVGKKTENFSTPNIGVASMYEIYGYSFFLMDNRTFRSPLGETPEQHFGDEQMNWLLENLEEREHAFIGAGSQFFGGYSHIERPPAALLASESFQGEHPQRFSYFIEQLQTINTKVVFLSGDRHYAEVMAIPEDVLGYRTHELTSSPVGNFLTPFPNTPNQLRVDGNDTHTNFMLVEVTESGTGLNLHATAYSTGGKVLFRGNYDTE